MNPPQTASSSTAPAESEDVLSALFANLVLQQTQMALMLLGRVAHPETGQTVQDVDGARMLIDQLEMLEVKTRGNLVESEAKLLKQNLMALHMAFVEAVERSGPASAAPSSGAGPAGAPTPQPAPAPEAAAEAAEAESRKKFSKKY